MLSRLVPFASVASAGVVNISCIRWKEMRDGIEVFRLKKDAEGNEEKEILGKSSKAGQLAVGQSAASRIFTNIPTLILPPVLMSVLERRGTFAGPRGKLLGTVTQLTSSGYYCRAITNGKRTNRFTPFTVGLALGVFLPPAIAYFPQRAAISPEQLEEPYHKYRGEQLYFNKGL